LDCSGKQSTTAQYAITGQFHEQTVLIPGAYHGSGTARTGFHSPVRFRIDRPSQDTS